MSEFNILQRKAFDLLCNGDNVFITGGAGTGKSWVLEQYYTHACAKFNHYCVSKTSSTGISSILINGRTLHSWAGIILGQGTVDELITKMRPGPVQRWKKVKVLFIDEISMINPELFDKLEAIARKIRNCDEPFGGIQVVITGDFFQLPVVKCPNFCFESKCWDNVVKHTVELEEIVRQKDPVFQQLLKNARYGNITDEESDLLQARINVEFINEFNIEPTLLYPRNREVDKINKERLDELILLNGKYEYKANFKKIILNISESKRINDFYTQFIDDDVYVPNDITLSKGAQIIFKKNIDENVANGTKGVITEFVECIDNGIEIFEKDTNFKIEIVKNPFAKKTPPLGTKIKVVFYPVVQLLNGQKRLLIPEEFEYKVDNEFIFTKKQLPVKLAWATTIHSSQGSTLDLVKGDIGKGVFDYGQAYVVLSRVRTLDSLTLIKYDRNAIMAHPKVIEYYNSLSQ